MLTGVCINYSAQVHGTAIIKTVLIITDMLKICQPVV